MFNDAGKFHVRKVVNESCDHTLCSQTGGSPRHSPLGKNKSSHVKDHYFLVLSGVEVPNGVIKITSIGLFIMDFSPLLLLLFLLLLIPSPTFFSWVLSDTNIVLLLLLSLCSLFSSFPYSVSSVCLQERFSLTKYRKSYRVFFPLSPVNFLPTIITVESAEFNCLIVSLTKHHLKIR